MFADNAIDASLLRFGTGYMVNVKRYDRGRYGADCDGGDTSEERR